MPDMTYEEKVVNGILCSRGAPDAPWEPLPAETITKRYLDTYKHNKELIRQLRGCERELMELRDDNYQAGVERSLID